jgi:hypothetical protein
MFIVEPGLDVKSRSIERVCVNLIVIIDFGGFYRQKKPALSDCESIRVIMVMLCVKQE